MKTLHLTVTRHWFDKLASGEKTEDIREIKGYWVQRLLEYFSGACISNSTKNPTASYLKLPTTTSMPFDFKSFDYVKIVNGYGHDKPTLIAKCTGIRITADDEQTDLGKGRFFAIGIGEIIERKNHDIPTN